MVKRVLKVMMLVIASIISSVVGFLLGAFIFLEDDTPLYFVAEMFFFIPVICVVSNYIFAKKK